MPQEKIIMFENRLRKVYKHLGRQAQRLNVSCYRVYDHDLPEFPFCIEIYEHNVYVAEYARRHQMSDEEHDEWMQQSLNVISEVLEVLPENIFLRLRRRKPGRLGQYQKVGQAQHEFVVHENGLKFFVNLSDYLDTGLFLDHRITREKVKVEAKDKKVLNLFCYTGSFSVYAAAGGAAEIISVDLSKTYLKWAERNMELNGFFLSSSSGVKYKFVHADVKQYLKDLPDNYFDLVVMDPPTFSNSKRMEGFLDIQRDHVELINDCLRAVKPGGVLYFSTNYRNFSLRREKIKATSIEDITKASTPFDFQSKLSRYCNRMVK
jgi:23S rRNA (cytosine1962-C5)-methyltransferase